MLRRRQLSDIIAEIANGRGAIFMSTAGSSEDQNGFKRNGDGQPAERKRESCRRRSFAREGLSGTRQNMPCTVTDWWSAIMACVFVWNYAAGKCAKVRADFPAIYFHKKSLVEIRSAGQKEGERL